MLWMMFLISGTKRNLFHVIRVKVKMGSGAVWSIRGFSHPSCVILRFCITYVSTPQKQHTGIEFLEVAV